MHQRPDRAQNLRFPTGGERESVLVSTLDTHATIKQLENAGMDSRQVEAVVAAFA